MVKEGNEGLGGLTDGTMSMKSKGSFKTRSPSTPGQAASQVHNSHIMPVPLAIASECFFRIFGQFVLPTGWDVDECRARGQSELVACLPLVLLLSIS
jgi:hypothetical protein